MSIFSHQAGVNTPTTDGNLTCFPRKPEHAAVRCCRCRLSGPLQTKVNRNTTTESTVMIVTYPTTRVIHLEHSVNRVLSPRVAPICHSPWHSPGKGLQRSRKELPGSTAATTRLDRFLEYNANQRRISSQPNRLSI